MENLETWNKVVKLFKENYSRYEYTLQSLWENIFKELLHYSSLDNEIEIHRSIHLGSTDKVIPDIILKKDNKDLVVVELKLSNTNIKEKYQQQLFSYLKQLKVSIGILISDKIYLFSYDYTKEDFEQQCVEIDFVYSSVLGEKFIQLFDKHNLDVELIKEFVIKNCKIKDEYYKIKEITTEEYVKDVLKNSYKALGYDEISINKYLENIVINLKDKPEYDIYKCRSSSGENRVCSTLINKVHNLSKNDALRMCAMNNVPISNYVTFANLSSKDGKYPANVKLDYPNHDWTLILNDEYNKNLHILQIPANTFSYKDFYIRTDKNLIVLLIDTSFVDIHPQSNIENRLYEFKVKTINY